MNDVWLAHHGIKGQKWGVRRYQNPDGSLTAAGKERYTNDLKISEKEGTYSDGSTYKRTTFKNSESKQKLTKADKEFVYSEEELKEIADEYGISVDKFSEYDKFNYRTSDKFDEDGATALYIYNRKGKDEASKYLKTKLKDYSYEYAITEDFYEDGERFTSFYLRIFGNEYFYSTGGDEDYTDDQYFGKRNKGV